jgi:MarR family transcriptional regulator for hemolysin
MMSDLPEPSLGERFSAALHNTARDWRLLVDKKLKHLGIGQAGWMTIAMIAKSLEPMSQRALADLVGVEGPSMVSMLDRLEREGLVTRAPSPTDRRVKLVHLTDAGTKLYQQVRDQAGTVRAALLGDIDPATLAAATELLELLRTRIEEQL